MRCRSLHGIANTPYLRSCFFPVLPCVAPYCARRGVNVTLYLRYKVVHAWFLLAHIGSESYFVRLTGEPRPHSLQTLTSRNA
jgi:hypothetical protein